MRGKPTPEDLVEVRRFRDALAAGELPFPRPPPRPRPPLELSTSRIGDWLRGRGQRRRHKIAREERTDDRVRLVAGCGVEVLEDANSEAGEFCGNCERWRGGDRG